MFSWHNNVAKTADLIQFCIQNGENEDYMLYFIFVTSKLKISCCEKQIQ